LEMVAENIISSPVPNIYNSLIRRILIFILLVSGIVLSYGQDSIFDYRLNISLNNYSVYDILRVIEKEINYNFSYNSSLIDADRVISINMRNKTLRAVLDKIIDNKSLKYRVIGNNIVIYEPGTEIERIPETLLPESVSIFKIEGKIIDKNTKKPIEYANISVIGKSIGTVSNNDGEFVMKISPAFIYDSIGISCLGYELYKEQAINLVSKYNIISLVPDFIPIQEVIIRKIDPISLLTSAIEKIPENYSDKPAILTSFYRESIKESRRYVIVSEAVLQTYKSSYTKPDEKEQIKIIKARTSRDISKADTVILKLKAGLGTTLLLDIVKHPAYFFSEENLQYYSYRMADVMIDNDKEAYVIKFDHRENNDYPPYTGRIYLDINSLAVKAVDFSFKQDKIEKATHFLVIKKPRYLRVKPIKAEYSVKFKEFNNKYYLNFIRCETEFKIRKKKQLFGKDFNTEIELAVTDIDTLDVKRFKPREVAKTMNIFTDQVIEYNDSYWEDYNYIKPDEPLEEALKKLSP
jgi:hypothetical protein